MWYNKSIDEIESNLKTNIKEGLSKEEYLEKLNEYGYNKLNKNKSKNIVQMIVKQLKDSMFLILIIAAIITFLLGKTTDLMIIIVLIIVNSTLEIIEGRNAKKSLKTFKKLSSLSVKVIRSGIESVVLVEELVPGDIILIEAGDYIPADVRIIESENLKVEELLLTGESIVLDKICTTLEYKNLPLVDRKNMSFMGSMVTSGRGRAIVVETAMNTEICKIAEFAHTVEE